MRDHCDPRTGSGAVPSPVNPSGAFRQEVHVGMCSCKVVFRRIMGKNSEPGVALLLQVPNGGHEMLA